MSDSGYSVIFTGTIEPGRDLDEVKRAVASRFKLLPEQVDKLFASPGVAVKQDLDEEAARKLQRAFAAVGVVVDVRSVEAGTVPELEPHAPTAHAVAPNLEGVQNSPPIRGVATREGNGRGQDQSWHPGQHQNHSRSAFPYQST